MLNSSQIRSHENDQNLATLADELKALPEYQVAGRIKSKITADPESALQIAALTETNPQMLSDELNSKIITSLIALTQIDGRLSAANSIRKFIASRSGAEQALLQAMVEDGFFTSAVLTENKEIFPPGSNVQSFMADKTEQDLSGFNDMLLTLSLTMHLENSLPLQKISLVKTAAGFQFKVANRAHRLKCSSLITADDIAHFNTTLKGEEYRSIFSHEGVKSIGIITYGRSEVLTLLPTLLENLRYFGHEGIRIVVFDQGDGEASAHIRTFVNRLQAENKDTVKLEYFGPEDRDNYISSSAQKIVARTKTSPESVRQELQTFLGVQGKSGANFNLASAILAADDFAILDDDVFPEVTVSLPGDRKTQIKVDVISALSRGISVPGTVCAAYHYSRDIDVQAGNCIGSYFQEPDQIHPLSQSPVNYYAPHGNITEADDVVASLQFSIECAKSGRFVQSKDVPKVPLTYSFKFDSHIQGGMQAFPVKRRGLDCLTPTFPACPLIGRDHDYFRSHLSNILFGDPEPFSHELTRNSLSTYLDGALEHRRANLGRQNNAAILQKEEIVNYIFAAAVTIISRKAITDNPDLTNDRRALQAEIGKKILNYLIDPESDASLDDSILTSSINILQKHLEMQADFVPIILENINRIGQTAGPSYIRSRNQLLGNIIKELELAEFQHARKRSALSATIPGTPSPVQIYCLHRSMKYLQEMRKSFEGLAKALIHWSDLLP